MNKFDYNFQIQCQRFMMSVVADRSKAIMVKWAWWSQYLINLTRANGASLVMHDTKSDIALHRQFTDESLTLAVVIPLTVLST